MLESNERGAAASVEPTLLGENTELVRRIAWRLHRRLPHSVQIEDLIQAGMVGLLEAHERYRPNHDASFATFAGIRIRGAMLDEIRRGDWAPRSLHRAARSLAKARARVERRSGRAALGSEIAEVMGISMHAYRRLCADVDRAQLTSLDAAVDNRSSPEAAGRSALVPHVAVEEQDTANAVARAARQLPKRDRWLLWQHYEHGKNLCDIAKRLGVSGSRVSQLHGRALRRVRDVLEGDMA